MPILILIVLGALFLMWFQKKQKAKQVEAQKQKTEYDNLHPEEVKDREYTKYYASGRIISGHPDIAKPYLTNIKVTHTEIIIYEVIPVNTLGQKIGEIQLSQIKSAKVEDRSTIEKHITAGRILLLGLFALAAQKSEKHEDFYLVISWGDGRFDFETIFEFEGNPGYNALEVANQTCNVIIKHCREQVATPTEIPLKS